MLPCDSGIPPSAPRTGQVACTTSGAPMPAAHRIFAPTLLLWFREPIALPLGFLCPECLDPFPLSSGFPDALDGRDLRRVLRARCPHTSIGDLSTYPLGKLVRGPALLA